MVKIGLIKLVKLKLQHMLSTVLKLLIFFMILGFQSLYAQTLVDVNSADFTQLQQIHGVGPKKAQAIIEYRNVHGKFHSASELDNVKGFSAATVAKITNQIEIK